MPRIKDLDVGSATGAQLVANSSDDEAILVEASDFATAAQGTNADNAVQPGDTHAADSKTTPVDADELPLQDSTATYGLKKLTWSNLKATLKTYLDTLYQPVDADLTSIAGLSPSNDDIIQRKSGSWANRTMAQLLADLAAFVGDSGSGGTKGLVPAPGTGDATKYLKGDGTWDTPAGGGGGGSGDVVGPASSVAGNFASYDDTTGKLLEDSGKSASDFQTANSKLTDIAALAVTDSNIIVGNGTTWVAESGATARTSLGLGTGDSPQFTGVNVGHASDTTITRVSSGVAAVEGNPIATISAGVLTVTATSSGPSEIRLREDTDNGTNQVGFKAPASITADAVWELPAADGTAGQVLKTNGSKVLSFGDAGAAGLTLLQTQNPSASASVIFTSGFSSTYDHYIFVFEGLALSASTNLDAQLSIDGGSSFISSGYAEGWTELNGATALTGGAQTAEMRLCRTAGTGASRSINGELNLIINQATYANVFGVVNSGQRNATVVSGVIDAGARVNGIKFYPTSGTCTGIVKMFGVKK